MNSFAYASFLASGPIAYLLPTILASALIATCVMSLVLTRLHSRASALGGPAGNAAAVVGAALTCVLAHDGNAASRWADVAVVLALSAFVPGLAMLALRRLRLAQAIRFLPYPIFAGFLAGTGWLLVAGSARIADAPGPLAAAVAFAALLRLAQQRWKSPLLVPAAVVVAALGVHLSLTAAHISLDAARGAHWLYPRFAAAGLAIVTPAALAHANWGAIASAWSAFAWVAVVVILVSMMNTVALEAETGADTDVERDLGAIGVANIAAAVCGGFGSQLLLPGSALAIRDARGSRLPGYVVAATALLAVIAAVTAIPYLPKPVFAGLIAFAGLRLLEQHAVGALRTMPRQDAFAVCAMLAATTLWGLPAALATGFAVMGLVSVIDAGRQRVITQRASLRDVRERADHTREHACILDRDGDGVEILTLRGQLFFGTVNAMYEDLQSKIRHHDAPLAIVLDFANVDSVDVSAAMTLAKIARRTEQRAISLLLCAIAPATQAVLRKNGALPDGARVYATIDEAIAACEALVIARAEQQTANPTPAHAERERPEMGRSCHAICERWTAMGALTPA